MEADLSRFHHLDLRDRWRFEEVILASGRRVLLRKLTTRMIYVRIKDGLPPTSSLAIHFNGGRWPWTLTDHLLADLYYVERQAIEGKKAKDHPGRPKPTAASRTSPERDRKMRDARRRARAEEARRNRRRSESGG